MKHILPCLLLLSAFDITYLFLGSGEKGFPSIYIQMTYFGLFNTAVKIIFPFSCGIFGFNHGVFGTFLYSFAFISPNYFKYIGAYILVDYPIKQFNLIDVV